MPQCRSFAAMFATRTPRQAAGRRAGGFPSPFSFEQSSEMKQF
jgi:hypothetical protein